MVMVSEKKMREGDFVSECRIIGTCVYIMINNNIIYRRRAREYRVRVFNRFPNTFAFLGVRFGPDSNFTILIWDQAINVM